jgi:capsular polysaccharide export protein
MFRVPPFPGSLAVALARPGAPTAPFGDDRIDRLIDRVADLKAAGAFWAAQPPLPDRQYTLVRIADDAVRADACRSATGHVVIWTDVGGGGDICGECDPWHLLSGASRLIIDADDALAVIGAIARVPVDCVGDGPYSSLATGQRSALRDKFRLMAVDGLAYADPFTGREIDLAAAIELCGFWRSVIDSSRHITAAVGFAFWKRGTIAPLLWSGVGRVPFSSGRTPVGAGDTVAVWKSRTPAQVLARLENSGACLVEVEDGFIRSTGLGADCVPPLSIVVDRLGIYFDPQQPSDLEEILRTGIFTPGLLERARQLRELIIDKGISKYGAGTSRLERRDPERRHVLVPGQVEDDRSVLCGGGEVSTNLELLRRARLVAPGAFIIYKPHPDVEAGHRKGAIADKLCLRFADEIVREAPISAIIDLVDEVHVNTSLAGFEALLRGKPVTTHGVPFYSGWGLTSDLGPVPQRRNLRRSLDELVAAALMLYPRYLDPATGLPCPPEIMIRRLFEGGTVQGKGPVVWLRRFHGRFNRFLSKLW